MSLATPRRRLRHVQQLQATDCGPACLTIVLGFHGRPVPLETVQEALVVGRDGARGEDLLRVGEVFGLRGRGLLVEGDALLELPRGAILHWGFDHFVVFDRVRRQHVDIIDPASGRRRVSLSRFRRLFTGAAFVFEPAADFTPSPRKPSPYWAQLRRLLFGSGVLAQIVVVSFILRGVALAGPALTGLVIDLVIPRSDLDLLLAMVGGAGLVVGFQLVASAMRGLFLLRLRGQLDLDMNVAFLDHLLALPYAFFHRRSDGDLLMRINGHSTVRELLTTSAIEALIDGPLVLLYLMVLLAASPVLALVVLGLAALTVGSFAAGRLRFRELATQELDARARAQGYLVHLVGGVETLKAQGVERVAAERWSHLFVDEVNASLERGRWTVIADALKSALGVGGPLLVLTVGAVQVVEGTLSLGTMMAMSAVAVSILGPLDALIGHALQLQVVQSYVERIDDALRTKPERRGSVDARAPRLSGKIELAKVWFGYPGRRPLLQDISVDTPAGSMLAIVGPSGAGKSTLARLLVGLHEPTAGEILLDGRRLATLDLRAVRSQIGVVMQNTQLLPGSIRANIALGSPSASLPDVMAAAKLAGIHETIERMPMGYHTLVGDGGIGLSGGELQRVALARAIVGRPVMLLLDEATSAMDAETELQVMQNLEGMGCTRILIAHRLSTVVHADQILVVEDGRIVERGRHAELLTRRGRYAALVESQR